MVVCSPDSSRLSNATPLRRRILIDGTRVGIFGCFVSFAIIPRIDLFGYGTCSIRTPWNSFANIATK
jgi:hypothetical protein